jgi:hypothetical protein
MLAAKLERQVGRLQHCWPAPLQGWPSALRAGPLVQAATRCPGSRAWCRAACSARHGWPCHVACSCRARLGLQAMRETIREQRAAAGPSHQDGGDDEADGDDSDDESSSVTDGDLPDDTNQVWTLAPTCALGGERSGVADRALRCDRPAQRPRRRSRGPAVPMPPPLPLLDLPAALQLLETIVKIRRHDPSVYDKDATFFPEPASDSEGGQPARGSRRKAKPVFLRDMVAKEVSCAPGCRQLCSGRCLGRDEVGGVLLVIAPALLRRKGGGGGTRERRERMRVAACQQSSSRSMGCTDALHPAARDASPCQDMLAVSWPAGAGGRRRQQRRLRQRLGRRWRRPPQPHLHRGAAAAQESLLGSCGGGGGRWVCSAGWAVRWSPAVVPVHITCPPHLACFHMHMPTSPHMPPHARLFPAQFSMHASCLARLQAQETASSAA